MHSTSVKICILQANAFLKPSMSPNHMFCCTKCIPGGCHKGCQIDRIGSSLDVKKGLHTQSCKTSSCWKTHGVRMGSTILKIMHKVNKKIVSDKGKKRKKFDKRQRWQKCWCKEACKNGPKSKKCPRRLQEQHFYWRKRARRRGIARANAPKSGSKLSFLKALCLESFFKNVLPTEGGEHIFEKNMKNNDAKQECNQKCILELAFLM